MLRRIIFLSLILFSFQAHAQTTGSNYALVKQTSDHLGYFEHVPDSYNNSADTKYPLILFLHGVGERSFGESEDLKKILRWGPPKIISGKHPAYSSMHPYRFLVLAPQLNAPVTSWKPQQVHEFLNYALDNYRIDENRIYLTGVSMGGGGVWNYAVSELNSPNRIAAMAPISAWGNPGNACRVIEKGIPVWAFHGLQDKVIPIARGQAMFAGLQNCGQTLNSKDYRFSPLNAEHTAWPPVYGAVSDSLSIYDWFMKYSLAQSDTVEQPKTIWTPPPFVQAEATPYGQLPQLLNESSGLIIDRQGGLWTLNDSGNKASLYEIDTTASLIRTLRITSAPNIDWEDLARDEAGNLYIADIGNNLNVRRKLFIYKISPDDIAGESAAAEAISFVYEDQTDFPPGAKKLHYDAESLIHYKGNLYIFTKNRTEPFTGYTYVYKIPDMPGDYTAELVDSLKVGEGIMTNFWLTGADISPSGDRIALLSHDKLWILSCFEGGKFSDGHLTEIRMNSFTQKESVVFLDEKTLILSDERIRNILGGNLYRLEIPDAAIKPCE